MKIKQTKTDTLKSTEKDKALDVQIERTSRKMPYPNLRCTLDQYDQYRKELGYCDMYRLITTLRPYCSNVLFNPTTEIVNGRELINWENKSANSNEYYKEYVWSTEKSSKSNCRYLIGGDIFSNHILRNNSFKSLNYGGSSADQGHYTMGDVHRSKDKRTIDTHLYEYGDITPFVIDGDSPFAYTTQDYELKEIDGWYGFYNKTNIQTNANNDARQGSIAKVINNMDGGDFVMLYPTKELFLFNPVYNEDKMRPEYNWDIVLTYPYKSYTDNILVQDGDWNGIKVKCISTDGIVTNNGRQGFEITTYLPHNIALGEKFTLSYKDKDGLIHEMYKERGVYLTAVRLGDLKNKNDKYVLMISADDIQSDYNELFYNSDGELDNTLRDGVEFRVRKLRRSVESIYYFRVFRQLPNFKYADKRLDIVTVKDEDKLNEYLTNIENTGMGFDNDMYALGFAQTVYNDTNSQITYTDTIEPDMLVDNLGRPLTEIYTTIVKANRGVKEWYGDKKPYDDNVECSHCFGDVTMGLRCAEKYSSTSESDALERKWDIRYIDDSVSVESGNVSVKNNGLTFEIDGDVYQTVSKDDRYFMGDVVEFNAEQCKEYVLDSVYYRFNTWQRENIKDYNLGYQDIDKDGKCVPLNVQIDEHREGYFYKPHYRIQLKEFGELHTGEHKSLRINRSARYDRRGDSDLDAVNNDNHNCYLLRTGNKHGMKIGDYVRIQLKDKFYRGNVFHIPNFSSFVIDVSQFKASPVKNGVVWSDMTDDELNALKGLFQSSDLKWQDVGGIWKMYRNNFGVLEELGSVWKENPDVPWYAVKHPNKENQYLWRDVYKYGDIRCEELQNDVVFANGHIYLNQYIDFFLQRQDPYGYYGKRYIKKIPDVEGYKAPESPIRIIPFNDVIC